MSKLIIITGRIRDAEVIKSLFPYSTFMCHPDYTAMINKDVDKVFADAIDTAENDSDFEVTNDVIKYRTSKAYIQ